MSLGVPLTRGAEVIGYLSANRCRRGDEFSAAELRIALGIGRVASLVLDNVRLVEELERTSRVKSEFVATISHELRSPLNVILGYSELLLGGAFGELSAEQAESLVRLERSGRGAARADHIDARSEPHRGGDDRGRRRRGHGRRAGRPSRRGDPGAARQGRVAIQLARRVEPAAASHRRAQAQGRDQEPDHQRDQVHRGRQRERRDRAHGRRGRISASSTPGSASLRMLCRESSTPSARRRSKGRAAASASACTSCVGSSASWAGGSGCRAFRPRGRPSGSGSRAATRSEPRLPRRSS